jgi:trehalose 6-phosphate phosphatase
VLSYHPCAIVTDVDGTISDIVPRPEDASVRPEIRAALLELSQKLDLVAVITARDEATARRMVEVDSITYVGNYGLTSWATVSPKAVLQARNEIAPSLADLPCVTTEDKGVAFALHYRNCDEQELVRTRLLEIVRGPAERSGSRILEGKKVIELVPGDLPNKAAAFARLIESNRLAGVIYLGDDLSDIVVFREIARRRPGGLAAAGIAVCDDETDISVRESADLTVTGVDGVGRCLSARRLRPCS